MIFVTGGTGLLGSHFLYELTRNGHWVRALKRAGKSTELVQRVFEYYTPQPEALLARIEWVDGDLLDFTGIDEALDDITEIYHAGAVVSFYPKDHKAMLNVNVNGTANLVNLALHHRIEKFCYVSSVATLSKAENGLPSTEENYWQQSNRNTIYSVSKYGAEREVWRGMEEGLNAVIVNPSVILGPGFWETNSGLFRISHQGLKYYTLGVNGFVDVRDVALAMRLVMEANVMNQRFIVSSDNVSYQMIFNWMAKYFNKPVPSIHVSPLMSNIAWRVEAIRSFITGSLPEITKEMANTTSSESTYSSEKIKKAVNFTFRGLEDSIQEICGFYLRDLDKGRI